MVCKILLKRINLKTKILKSINNPFFFSLLISILIGASSCYGPKKIYYLQHLNDTTIQNSYSKKESTVHIGDQLYIFVSSLNTDASAVYNLPNFSVASANMQQGQTQNNPVAGYLVDNKGQIALPKIGSLDVAGFTFSQLKDTIQNRLSAYLKEPIVSIRLLNFRISVLGEVRNPGTFTVPYSDLTILQGLGLAGDLTIYGVRESVLLIRQTDKEKITYRINLTDKKLMLHPAYFIQSGDVIYVEPNKTKMNTSSSFFQVWPAVASAITLLILVLNNIPK
jgi:polysaccharide export outer membrane protein